MSRFCGWTHSHVTYFYHLDVTASQFFNLIYLISCSGFCWIIWSGLTCKLGPILGKLRVCSGRDEENPVDQKYFSHESRRTGSKNLRGREQWWTNDQDGFTKTFFSLAVQAGKHPLDQNRTICTAPIAVMKMANAVAALYPLFHNGWSKCCYGSVSLFAMITMHFVQNSSPFPTGPAYFWLPFE